MWLLRKLASKPDNLPVGLIQPVKLSASVYVLGRCRTLVIYAWTLFFIIKSLLLSVEAKRDVDTADNLFLNFKYGCWLILHVRHSEKVLNLYQILVCTEYSAHPYYLRLLSSMCNILNNCCLLLMKSDVLHVSLPEQRQSERSAACEGLQTSYWKTSAQDSSLWTSWSWKVQFHQLHPECLTRQNVFTGFGG